MDRISKKKLYSELIKKLFNANLHGGMKLGLSNSLCLDTVLNFPSRSFPAIHVAGSNGKGSVTKKIASAYQFAGYRVGLFTSPHISCFRERIRINDQMISEEEVAHLLSQIFDVAKNYALNPTFFELTTLLAFHYFAQEKVDMAVLEVGLGGRLDATNIITPQLSVITSISLEHTEILGKTLEEIAIEKAGIIKPHIPVVLGPRVPFQQLQRIAAERESPCTQVEGIYETFDEENQAIAKAALELLCLPSAAIEKGLKERPPCRFETWTRQQLPKYHNNTFPEAVILDVAHNPDGLLHLFKAIRNKHGIRPLRVLFGLSKTKDISACLAILKANGNDFHLVEAQNGRGMPPQQLKEGLLVLGVTEDRVNIDSTIEESLRKAMREASNQNQILVICGTFFIMGKARRALGLDEPCDAIDMNEACRV